MDKELPIFTATYDLLIWYSGKYNLYPRKYKFIVGEKLFSSLLNLIEIINKARYSHSKESELQEAIIESDKIKYLSRISKDLNCISLSDYEYFSSKLVEIGKMITGWTKYIKNKKGES